MKNIEEIREELQTILADYDMELPSDETLDMEIKSAIGAINRCRRFTPTDKALYDVTYEDKIIPLALTSIMKFGAEGETEHSENNVIRRYGNANKYPREMLEDIVPLAKFY